MRSSITSSFVESKVRLYIKLFVVLHFTVRMHLGMPKKKKQLPAQLLLLVFPEEIHELASHTL